MTTLDRAPLWAGIVLMAFGMWAPWLADGNVIFALGLGLSIVPAIRAYVGLARQIRKVEQ